MAWNHMRWNERMSGFGGVAGRAIAVCLLLAANGAGAQTNPGMAPSGETIPALFVSDIHFEPFFDPGKVAQLAAAPVSEWKEILAAAPSADREQRFAVIEQSCRARGEDTAYALLESSVQAMRKEAAGAKFMTVSGDLIAHAFQCKYGAVFPHAAPGDYRAFVEKTVDFVIGELSSAVHSAPAYVALGNNDSDCGDYQLDANSEFLTAVGEEVARTFPADERKGAAETFTTGGYYNVRLPAAVPNARMIVLDDQFMGAKYSTCGSKADTSAADAQLAWLAQQLAEARRNREKVWVMAHIPPGVDVRASVTRMDAVCSATGPKMFLASEKLADVLAEFGDVVELAIFAHTHMDEVRVLKTENGAQGAASSNGVAVKMVSSISPIDGNAPSFTVARVESSTAALKDYKVFAASNATGVDTAWHEEYDWGKTFHESDFSATAVSKLIAGFAADRGAKTEASHAYIRNFYAGVDSPLLGLVWPQYVCGLRNDSAQGFKACVCPAAK
ncbi:MAG TPA: metallophosphoesterase [Terracidiphilus sp.]|nr:metallophosphoesterase [Terracidiphilus sp.]